MNKVQNEITLPFGGFYKNYNEIKPFIDKFPKWVKLINGTFQLILTNDIDSLFACALIMKKFNCNIGFFYDFNSIHMVKGVSTTKEKIIAVDMAVESGKAFDNHVVKINRNDEVNPESANLNIVYNIHQDNYFSKYGGSTALMVSVMYEMFDFKTLTENQLMILACIDSFYMGAYHPNTKNYVDAREAFENTISIMKLDVFKELFARKKAVDFENFAEIHGLKGTMWVRKKDCKLQTDINIDFIKSQFPMLNFDIEHLQFDKNSKFSKSNKNTLPAPQSKSKIDKLFTFALTRKYGYKATIK
ncbi:hypothetical protein [Viridibacillus arvi]|uniref:hypothetical protein n=1 Tax=Viridibacillus arvi TaxID=263475 RepID=UPI003D2CBC6B